MLLLLSTLPGEILQVLGQDQRANWINPGTDSSCPGHVIPNLPARAQSLPFESHHLHSFYHFICFLLLLLLDLKELWTADRMKRLPWDRDEFSAEVSSLVLLCRGAKVFLSFQNLALGSSPQVHHPAGLHNEFFSSLWALPCLEMTFPC